MYAQDEYLCYPRMSRIFKTYNDFLNSPIKLILGYPTNLKRSLLKKIIYNSDLDEYKYGLIYIHPGQEYPYLEYIDKPVEGKYVYLDSILNGANLVPDDPQFIYTTDEPEDNPEVIRIYPHPDHKTFGDLAVWGHTYVYHSEDNSLRYSDNIKDHIKNFMKNRIRMHIFNEVGDEYERISDYSKVIYWLLSKNRQYLNAEQIELLDRVLVPSSHVTKVLKRDVLVKETIEKLFNETIPNND